MKDVGERTACRFCGRFIMKAQCPNCDRLTLEAPNAVRIERRSEVCDQKIGGKWDLALVRDLGGPEKVRCPYCRGEVKLQLSGSRRDHFQHLSTADANKCKASPRSGRGPYSDSSNPVE